MTRDNASSAYPAALLAELDSYHAPLDSASGAAPDNPSWSDVWELRSRLTNAVDAATTAIREVDRLRTPTPGFGAWQAGDVVRAAGNDHAEDLWAYLPDDLGYEDRTPWRPLRGGDVSWLSRDGLPADLTLLVRNGQPAWPDRDDPQASR